ncbi:hypothetical protein [Burkholderia sp. SRS-W-2-2016]|uniref:hypothetical protein n=1 Tax=Burkholderia sp. SRS-W-2-2016 TaxID=1926878 RepID=UPI001180DF45|nr:hypothetical protein [Burkholderia sp. SRS-W-2-2016]
MSHFQKRTLFKSILAKLPVKITCRKSEMEAREMPAVASMPGRRVVQTCGKGLFLPSIRPAAWPDRVSGRVKKAVTANTPAHSLAAQNESRILNIRI